MGTEKGRPLFEILSEEECWGMIYTKGRRGKSKSEVRLSVDTSGFGCVTVMFHVWEGGKITHSFDVGTRDFLEAMRNCATLALRDADRRKD